MYNINDRFFYLIRVDIIINMLEWNANDIQND